MELRVVANGQETRFELPYSIDEEGAQDTISQACDLICEEFVRLQAGHAQLRPATRSWFRPVSYELISHCVQYSLNYLINRRSLDAKRYSTTQRQSENVFSLGMMGILSKQKGALDERTRYNLANEMMYSYRHYVPRPFINGFISQAGKLNLQKTFEFVDIEFEHWIISQRLLRRDFGGLRGVYPKRIEDQLRAIRYDNDQHMGAIFDLVSYASKKRWELQNRFAEEDNNEKSD